MKKFVSLLLVVCLLFSSSGTIFAVSCENDKEEVIKVTENHLEECAFALYFNESRLVEKYTIEAVKEDQKTVLLQLVEEYPNFRKTQQDVPYEDTCLNTGDISILEENLTLQNEKISYYGHLHELEKITYSYFIPSYDVVNCTVNGDFATVNVYESLDFQYSDCDEPSFVLTHYYISLFKVNGIWLIAAVESDDVFYQAYYESGFDLEKEITGIDEAYKTNLIENTNVGEEANVSLLTLRDLDKTYNTQNAANYALTYSTSSDDGGSTPTYKFVMVPLYFRGDNADYLYGDLQNALVMGPSGVTVTLYGRASTSVSTLKLKIYAPGSSISSATYTAYNTSSLGGSFTFDETGTWQVVVSGTGLDPYTYRVRVV